ncbi:hypothetical protein O181_051448 [Austropuccinia psidii MF-1]|uniref:Uncharacterized protein n=1 Tax=Austropuccinia psidii MF-1 TaxID=1389203 RepID=A0A9Q3HND4_9BASI|nr:hypothetical protein [Austropuccinia psidii MF-1]
MSPVFLRDLGFQRNQPEDREGLSRTRRPGRGHLGHSGPEGYGSSSSAPPIPQRFVSMEHGKQEVQPGISLGRTRRKLPEDLSQRDRLQRPYGNHQSLESHQEVQTPGGEGKQDKGESRHYSSYRRTEDPEREYSDSFRLTRGCPNQLSSGLTPFRNQQISGLYSQFFTIAGSFQEKTRIQGQRQDHLQSEEERVRPNDTEDVGFGERSAQEPEVVVHNSRIMNIIFSYLRVT